jgi:KUP system potassium uptake protein
VNVETAPRVPDAQRIEVRRLDDRFSLVILNFGYMEQPNVPMALALGRPQGLRTEIMSTSYFLNRRTFRATANRRMPFWQSRLYVSMAKAASDATDFYRIPSNRVLELGQQFTI